MRPAVAPPLLSLCLLHGMAPSLPLAGGTPVPAAPPPPPPPPPLPCVAPAALGEPCTPSHPCCLPGLACHAGSQACAAAPPSAAPVPAVAPLPDPTPGSLLSPPDSTRGCHTLLWCANYTLPQPATPSDCACLLCEPGYSVTPDGRCGLAGGDAKGDEEEGSGTDPLTWVWMAAAALSCAMCLMLACYIKSRTGRSPYEGLTGPAPGVSSGPGDAKHDPLLSRGGGGGGGAGGEDLVSVLACSVGAPQSHSGRHMQEEAESSLSGAVPPPPPVPEGLPGVGDAVASGGGGGGGGVAPAIAEEHGEGQEVADVERDGGGAVPPPLAPAAEAVGVPGVSGEGAGEEACSPLPRSPRVAAVSPSHTLLSKDSMWSAASRSSRGVAAGRSLYRAAGGGVSIRGNSDIDEQLISLDIIQALSMSGTQQLRQGGDPLAAAQDPLDDITYV